MRLLYIADNGFAYHDGKYYYARPNAVNSKQYSKYFSQICFIARNSVYQKSMLPIDEGCKVTLVGRYDTKGLKRAMEYMAAEYDIVLVRNGLLGCFAAKYAKLFGKKLISYCGADPFEFQLSQGTLKGKLIAHYWRHLEKRKMMLGDYAHYCTNVLYERYPCDCPYLVCSNVSVKPEEKVLQKRLEKIKAHRNSMKIGLIGQYRENESKGILTVAKALGVLKGGHRFEVVGDGDPSRYDAVLTQLGLKEKVGFLGYLSDKNKINEWLDSLDLYVQPSLSEGLPRATIEAMSRGCPVIASNVCGMVDILKPDYLIKPKDYRDMAIKIEWLTSQDEMLKAAKVNFAKAAEYAEDIRDRKLDDFFQSITQGK